MYKRQVKDIATANMDVFDTGILAKSQTTYRLSLIHISPPAA